MSNNKISMGELISKTSSSNSQTLQQPSISEVSFFEQEMNHRGNNLNQQTRDAQNNKKAENNEQAENNEKLENNEDGDSSVGKKPIIPNKDTLESKTDILAEQLKHMVISKDVKEESELAKSIEIVPGEEQLLASGTLTPAMLAAIGSSSLVDDVTAVQGVKEVQLNELVQQILATAPTNSSNGEVKITLAQVFPGTEITLQRNTEGALLVSFLASGAVAYQQISSVQESLKRRLEVIEGKNVSIEVDDLDNKREVQDVPNA